MTPRAVSHWILSRRSPSKPKSASLKPRLVILLHFLPISLKIFNSTVLCLCSQDYTFTSLTSSLLLVAGLTRQSPLAFLFFDMLQGFYIKQDLHPLASFWWWFWQSAGPHNAVLFSPREHKTNVRTRGGLKTLRICSGFLSGVGNAGFCHPKDEGAVLGEEDT